MPAADKYFDDGQRALDPNKVKRLTDLEGRVAAMEDELKIIKAALVAIPEAFEKEKIEIRKSLGIVAQLQNGFKDVTSNSENTSKVVGTLERRVEVIKKDATSGFVISTIIFSILVILSLFARS